MAEMADSADDDVAAVICLIARKRKRRRPKSAGAVMDNATVKWGSISVVNTRCIPPFCRHDIYYSQPITAHGLPRRLLAPFSGWPTKNEQVRKRQTYCWSTMLANFLNTRQTFVCQHCWQTRWPTFVCRVSTA